MYSHVDIWDFVFRPTDELALLQFKRDALAIQALIPAP